MKEIEEMLHDIGHDFDNINVPDELEGRLNNALKHKKKKRTGTIIKAASLIIAVLIIGYNFSTFAYYGKKIMGYDNVMNGTLKELNALGKGQSVGKSFTFKDGTTLTLDGIMLDDNKLVALYTLKNQKGNVDKINFGPFMRMKGSFGEHLFRSSYGNMNKKKTEIKYVADFETPNTFERKLDFEFYLENGQKQEKGDISFMLDRNKAMGHTLKKTINKTIKVDETNIRINSISASPICTIIDGTVQNIFELASDQIRGERFRPNNIALSLIANGIQVTNQGGGMSTDMQGIRFHSEYDPLPSNLKELKLKLISFGADHDVNQIFDMNKNSENQSIEVLGQKIDIGKVSQLNGDTYITISSTDDLRLSRVYAIIDGKNISLKETISDKYDKHPDGTITHTRTMHFPGSGKDIKLDIKKMTYTKIYNKTIEIPLN